MTDLDLKDSDSVASVLERAADCMLDAANRDGAAVRLPARGRLVATGDLHDNTFHLQKIVSVAALDASEDHHVVLHEMVHGDRLVNGMDFSYRMLVRVAELVVRYPDQVHPILANHELAQMTGRGVSKGAGNSVELFADALDFVFGENSGVVTDAINRFIRSMALAVVSDGGVLCAHSLPAAAQMSHFDVDVLDRVLADADYDAPHGAVYLMTWGRRFEDEQVEQLARRWNVKLFVLGHAHVETGIEVQGPRVVILNSDHDRATVLPIDLAQVPEADEAFMYALPLHVVEA